MDRKITIEISTINGIKRFVTVSQSMKVDELKEMIKQQINVEKECIHLIFKSTGLENEKQLKEYGIDDGSKIIFIRLKKTKQPNQSKTTKHSKISKLQQNETIEMKSKSTETQQNEMKTKELSEDEMLHKHFYECSLQKDDNKRNTSNYQNEISEDDEDYYDYSNDESISNGMSEEFLDLSIGEDSFEEMMGDLQFQCPEMAEQIRDNPNLLAAIVQAELEEMAYEANKEMKEEEEEINGYKDQIEEEEIEGQVIDLIRMKISNGESLTELENNILNEDDEKKSKQFVFQYILIEEGYPERIVIESLKNETTLKGAREYCKQYLN